MLYTLSRYQRECTWFEADALAKLASEADSRKVEEVLDKHLRTGSRLAKLSSVWPTDGSSTTSHLRRETAK
jgi:hypothetical protein